MPQSLLIHDCNTLNLLNYAIKRLCTSLDEETGAMLPIFKQKKLALPSYVLLFISKSFVSRQRQP
jgi:hypothetical protein